MTLWVRTTIPSTVGKNPTARATRFALVTFEATFSPREGDPRWHGDYSKDAYKSVNSVVTDSGLVTTSGEVSRGEKMAL